MSGKQLLLLCASIALTLGAEIYRIFKFYIETKKTLAEIRRLGLEITELKAKAAERTIRTPTYEETITIDTKQAEIIRRATQDQPKHLMDQVRPTLLASIAYVYLFLLFLSWIAEKLFPHLIPK